MTPELTEEENRALIELLNGTINQDRYPLSPRVRTLKGIFAKLEPPAAVAPTSVPAAKPGDRPRAAILARKRQRRR